MDVDVVASATKNHREKFAIPYLDAIVELYPILVLIDCDGELNRKGKADELISDSRLRERVSCDVCCVEPSCTDVLSSHVRNGVEKIYKK
jgi:hypothetical protein